MLLGFRAHLRLLTAETTLGTLTAPPSNFETWLDQQGQAWREASLHALLQYQTSNQPIFPGTETTDAVETRLQKEGMTLYQRQCQYPVCDTHIAPLIRVGSVTRIMPTSQMHYRGGYNACTVNACVAAVLMLVECPACIDSNRLLEAGGLAHVPSDEGMNTVTEAIHCIQRRGPAFMDKTMVTETFSYLAEMQVFQAREEQGFPCLSMDEVLIRLQSAVRASAVLTSGLISVAIAFVHGSFWVYDSHARQEDAGGALLYGCMRRPVFLAYLINDIFKDCTEEDMVSILIMEPRDGAMVAGDDLPIIHVN